MKKMLFLSVILLISTCLFSQTVKKGSLLGLHKGTVTLSPNVTMAQFKDYYFNALYSLAGLLLMMLIFRVEAAYY